MTFGFCISRVFLRSTASVRFSASTVITRSMAYSVEEHGSQYSLNYSVYFKKGNDYISPFHDIPLYANADKTVLNMVMEVPRWSNAKMEITRPDALNPIKQDVKKGKPRFVSNVFPYHGYMWNYGALPQTWEDPSHVDSSTQCKGDNDPLDACEIGYRVAKRGDVRQVKLLGCVALIDEGETDWKMLTIDVTDPLASRLNDVTDIETVMPGFLAATVEWFTKYKVPAGKPKNHFAFNGNAKDKAFASNVVSQTHDQWRRLMNDQQTGTPSISRTNTTVQGPYLVSQTAAAGIVSKALPHAPDTPIDPIVDTWHYVQ